MDRSLRPALIVSEHTVSEYSTGLHHLLAGLADESIPTTLVCPPGCDVDSIVPPAVELIRHPAFDLPLLWRQNRGKLTERLGKFGPTVLHCLCESKAKLAGQLARQLDLPYVLAVNSLQKRWRRLAVSSRHLARIIAPAESITANIAELYPKFAGRIERINIGTFVSETASCFRRPGRLTSVVTAHPQGDVRAFKCLLGAVRRLVIEGYEFMLVVIAARRVGASARQANRAERKLRKLLADLDLSQVVVSVPAGIPRRPVLAAGDIFILAHPGATFNPLLLEAMSVGSAVAGCKGGVDDLIIEGVTSVVFDPNDQISIKTGLQRLFDRPEFARQLARNAQQYLRENHTVSGMVSAVLQTYQAAQKQFKR